MGGKDLDTTEQLTSLTPYLSKWRLIHDHFPCNSMYPSENHIPAWRLNKLKIAIHDSSAVDKGNSDRAGTVPLVVRSLEINGCK